MSPQEQAQQDTAAQMRAELYNRKFQLTLSTIGGVSAVIWATQTGHKGRFWWFLGGSALLGSVGLLIDQLSTKGK